MARNKRNTASKSVKRLPLSRDILIAVAREIIAKEGHEALSLRNLAAQLNVTAAALYAYVDDKLDLLRGVAAREFDRLVHLYEAVDSPEPIERIARMSYVYVDYARENPELFRAMFLFPPGVDDPVLGRHNRWADRAFSTVAEVVAQAIAERKLKAGDALLTSVSIWSAVHGVASVILLGAPVGRKREDMLVRSVVKSVILGLAEPDSPTGKILERVAPYKRRP